MNPSLTAPLMSRLWAKILMNRDSGCWEWVGALDQNGYGKFRVGGRADGHTAYAHRIVYEIAYEIPDDMELDHLCRNPKCVNPRHLEPVTHRENLRRGTYGRKTECPHGHSYDDALIRSNGKRVCRECNRIRCAARWARVRVSA